MHSYSVFLPAVAVTGATATDSARSAIVVRMVFMGEAIIVNSVALVNARLACGAFLWAVRCLRSARVSLTL